MADETEKKEYNSLEELFSGGSIDYLGVHHTIESERSKIAKKLSEASKKKSKNGDGHYLNDEEIKAATGKTVDELEIELDSDDEFGGSDIDAMYRANTKSVNNFEHYLDTKGTEQDYSDIITGKHSESMDWTFGNGYSARTALKNSKFNTPAVNSKIAQAMTGSEDTEDERRQFSEHFNLDWNTMSGMFGSRDWNDSYKHIINNNSFKEEHALKLSEIHPEVAGEFLSHNKMTDQSIDNFISKDDNWDHLGLDGREIGRLISRDANRHSEDGNTLSPKFARQVIKNAPHALRSGNFDQVMGSIDAHDRDKFFSEKLGITGGDYDHTKPNESEDFEADNWDNWNKPADSDFQELISNSKYLNDDHIEHLKRHGDFESKYALYHNENIDHKHGVEMYNKWSENHDTHGYDSEELTDHYKDHKDDILGFSDLPEDVQDDLTQSDSYYENVDEVAYQNYTMDDYITDNEDSIVSGMGSDYDKTDEIHEEMNDAHDWQAENPNTVQYSAHKPFLALDKLSSKHDNNLDHYSFTVDELKDDHNIDPAEYKLEPDEHGNIDGEELNAKLNEFGGPSTIDFNNHEDFTTSDHPEFDNRYEDAADSWRRDALNSNGNLEIIDGMYLYESQKESTGYQDALEEAGQYWKEDTSNYTDELSELYSTSHKDDRFIPEHIASNMPELNEIRESRRKGNLSADTSAIPDRGFEHSYGDKQHSHEMALDHANANDGSIDVGTLHKKFPNLKEDWKGIFAGKGKLSSEEIQGKIDEIPKTKYDISYGKWGKGKMQNLNGRDQVIIRLDHSDESLKPINDNEDKNVKEMFNKVQGISKQSGHPTNDRTIAWARVDMSDPNHWMIDEVQSDFGKTVTKYLKEQGAGDKANAIQTISDLHKDWRETLMNNIINTAKGHGVDKISTHSPESKHAHAGYSSGKIHTVYKDSYKKVPKRMGFTEDDSSNLPITDSGKKYFQTKTEDKQSADIEEHGEAFDHHMLHADMLNHMATKYYEPEDKHLVNQALDFASQHKSLADQHHSKLKTANLHRNWTPKTEFHNTILQANNDLVQQETTIEPHSADKKLNKPMGKPSQDVEFKGHTLDLSPESMKKSIDLIIDLIKFEDVFVSLLKKGTVDRSILLNIQKMRKTLKIAKEL